MEKTYCFTPWVQGFMAMYFKKTTPLVQVLIQGFMVMNL